MGSMSASQAQLTALFAESAFFGLHAATYLQCLRVLLWERGAWRSASSIRWPLLVAATLLLIGSTFDVALLFQHNLAAFIYSTDKGGSEAEFLKLKDWINIGKAIAFTFNTVVGDVVLIWRCWIIWDRQWIVVTPSIIFEIVGTVAALATPYLEATAGEDTGLITSRQINMWETIMIVLYCGVQILSTGLICYKMWSVSKRTSRIYSASGYVISATPIRIALVIFLESGLIVAIGSFVELGVALARSVAIYPVTDAMTPIMAIAFNLIIIRISRRREESFFPTLEPSISLKFASSPFDGNESAIPRIQFRPSTRVPGDDKPEALAMVPVASQSGRGARE